MSEAKVPQGTQLIARSALLLRLIANANHQGARLVDLTRHSGLERPTVRRILQGLVEQKLVRQPEGDKRYYLGTLVYELGLAAARGVDLPAIAEPSLDRIARETGDTVYLVQRSGLDSVCIDRKEGDFPVKVLTIDVGARRPLGSAAGGLAILAALDEKTRAAVIDANRSQMEPYERLYGRTLNEAVGDSIVRGYALMPINVVPYTSGVAISIPKRSSEIHAALSISAMSPRILDMERMASLVKILRREADLIAERIAL